MNQTETILWRLKRGDVLTPLDALKDCGSFRLAARVEELRKEGHLIETTRVDLQGGKFCAGYKMRPVDKNGQIGLGL